MRESCNDLMNEILGTKIEIAQLKLEMGIVLRRIDEKLPAKESNSALKIPPRKEENVYHNDYERGFTDGFNACIEEFLSASEFPKDKYQH